MKHASSETTRRRPRFARADSVSVLQVTERDVAIVRHVASHRFLRSTHISQLVTGSHKKILERLSLLYHAGYLDRPRAQIQYYVRGGGSEPLVYALGNRGARLLRSNSSQANVDWSAKNQRSGREFILHTLATADLSVALAVACRNSGVGLQDAAKLLESAPPETQSLPRPWTWRVQVRHGDQVSVTGVIPDLVFALILPDGRRRAFFVEIDQGTMPLERTGLSQTSVLRKLLAYQASHAQQLHTKRFGWKTFRALFVTAGTERLHNMRTLIGRTVSLPGSLLFLFAEHSAISPATALSDVWIDAQGKQHRLI